MRSEHQSNLGEERKSISIFDTDTDISPESKKQLTPEDFGDFETKTRALADEWLADPQFARDVNFLKHSSRALEMLRHGVANKIDVLKIEYKINSSDDIIKNTPLRNELTAYTKKLTKALREEFAKEILEN